MIRDTTPIQRRPRAESELLDVMLLLLKRKRPMTSGEIVTAVRHEFSTLGLPVPLAVDIRLMLRPPYFRLTDTGWKCLWNLPMKVERR